MRPRTRRLPEEMREELRRPLGKLMMGGIEEATKAFLDSLEGSRGCCEVIAVGDQSSKALLAAGGAAHVYIFDGRTQRKRTTHPKPLVKELIKVKNPAGMLTGEAREAVRRSVGRSEAVSIYVDGEEDLLALAAVLYAPLGSLVLYGQPGEGLVAVKVNKEKKDLVKSIINRMEVVS